MKTLLSICLASAFALSMSAYAYDEVKEEPVSIEPVRVEEPVPVSYETREVVYERNDDCDACKTTCNTCEYESNDKFVLAGMATERACNDCE